MTNNIFLIRHGESESNVDKTILQTKPNHLIELTEKGKEQAIETGKKLRDMLALGEFNWMCEQRFFVSPHIRAVQTYDAILPSIKRYSIKRYFQTVYDHRLREVDIGNFISPETMSKIREERPKVGKFYYRFPDGESMADVYVRVKQWINERPFKDSEYANIFIICHAGTINVLRMIFENLSVEQFNALDKPDNCQIISYLDFNVDKLYRNLM